MLMRLARVCIMDWAISVIHIPYNLNVALNMIVRPQRV